MSRLDIAEREVKLELIASIAKSQHALSRILSTVADFTDWSPEAAKHIGENVRLLTQLQESMAGAVTGWPLRRSTRKTGEPAPPWLNTQLHSDDKTRQ
ncbi:hypothetical protein [Paenibacillus radicis (ex Gao et al. 2016)]|uniref:Uncharacterized protein n=1 Tax=Paenibacillus radicis (ex Gao et al. 2016) TaxID=1737354 RepID=A0A917GMD7_9BACL|nr:hypothetical protein [Paenibacillus radicis (ex Gao et al. 2016)]GGG51679.1 hypothetical protein GCM10010918_00460 [Paenibacillus radicis (ex Gao et al. 2016)]